VLNAKKDVLCIVKTCLPCVNKNPTVDKAFIYRFRMHASMVRSVVFRRDRCSSEAEHQDPDLFFVYRQNLAGRPLIGCWLHTMMVDAEDHF
jgi:hypothetical protein